MQEFYELSNDELCALHKDCINISRNKEEHCDWLYHMMCEIADEISKRLSSNYDID